MSDPEHIGIILAESFARDMDKLMKNEWTKRKKQLGDPEPEPEPTCASLCQAAKDGSCWCDGSALERWRREQQKLREEAPTWTQIECDVSGCSEVRTLHKRDGKVDLTPILGWWVDYSTDNLFCQAHGSANEGDNKVCYETSFKQMARLLEALDTYPWSPGDPPVPASHPDRPHHEHAKPETSIELFEVETMQIKCRIPTCHEVCTLPVQDDLAPGTHNITPLHGWWFNPENGNFFCPWHGLGGASNYEIGEYDDGYAWEKDLLGALQAVYKAQKAKNPCDTRSEWPTVKIFRETLQPGVLEKTFVDHSASPPRAYPTGELYQIVGKAADAVALLPGVAPDIETITVYNPEDFVLYLYKRISLIPANCVIQEKPGDPV